MKDLWRIPFVLIIAMAAGGLCAVLALLGLPWWPGLIFMYLLTGLFFMLTVVDFIPSRCILPTIILWLPMLVSDKVKDWVLDD